MVIFSVPFHAKFIGVWLTVRYRNQKDPRGRGASNAFL